MILTVIKCIVQHIKYIPPLCCQHHPFPELTALPRLALVSPHYAPHPVPASTLLPASVNVHCFADSPPVPGVILLALLCLTNYIGKHFLFHSRLR